MKQEPTLMMGDLPIGIDFTVMDTLICTTVPKPIRVRDSLTKDKSKQNRFYQYESFEKARVAWKQLNGTKLPSIAAGFVIDLTFTMQDKEYCAFFSVHSLQLSRYEIYAIMSRYPSVLGVAHYRISHTKNNMVNTSCMLRFYDKEDCMQAVLELNDSPFESSTIRLTLAVRDIDELAEYVARRESQKEAVGVPAYHNIYEKRRVTQEEFNNIIISTPSFSDDLENSRWTDIILHANIHEKQYSRQSALNYYRYF